MTNSSHDPAVSSLSLNSKVKTTVTMVIMVVSCDPHLQVITSICRQSMDTKLSRDGQFSQVFEEALEVSIQYHYNP